MTQTSLTGLVPSPAAVPHAPEPLRAAPAATRPHRRALRWALTAGGVAAAIGLAWGGVRLVQRPPEVLFVRVRPTDVARMLAVTGRVEALRTVLVSPELPGRLTEIVRFEGERVKAGDVLAHLADPSATALVQQDRATLASKVAALADAKRDAERTQRLVSSGASPAHDLDAVLLAVAQGQADVTRLTSVLHDRRAQLTLVAPFDGTIVRREGELGQMVGPTTAVFEVATVASARVTAEVDERYVRALRAGMRAQILALDATGVLGAAQAATVSYVGQAVDPQTGAATVRFTFDAAPNDTLVGMSVDVNVVVRTVKGALTVPRESIGGAGARPFVLVVSGQRVERRELAFDDWPASSVVVRSGIAAGDDVIIDPKGALPGATVRAKEVVDGL